MVTANQLRIVLSPIPNLIPTVSTSVTMKLDDSNYLTWSFQIKLLLESHVIMVFVDGSRKCPPRFDDDSEIEGVEKDDYLMKIELQNIKKKGYEFVSNYLQKIKDARDHLVAAELMFEDDYVIIFALNGLLAKFNTFRCVIRGRENGISLKDFRSQLLAEEAIIGQSFKSSYVLPFGTTMVAGT
nr:uncharacterized protein LOC114827412 [Malus domestica]